MTSSSAQTNTDSLLTIWNDEGAQDTVRIDALIILARSYQYSKPDSTYNLAKLGLELTERSWLQERKSRLLNFMACARADLGAFSEALDLHLDGMKVSEQINDRSGVARSLNNIGWIRLKMGDPEVARKDFETCLKIQEELGDSMEIGGALINISMYHSGQNNLPEALGYLQRSLAIFTNLGVDRGIATALNNIGVTLSKQGDNRGALDHYRRGMVIFQRMGNLRRVAGTYNNIGLLEIELGRHEQAIVECTAGLELAKEIGELVAQKQSCECLYDAHKALGHERIALEFHERISVIQDSMQVDETAEKLELIEREKRMVKVSLQHEIQRLKDQLAQQQEVASTARTRYFIIGLVVVLLVVAGGLFSRMRYIKKANARLAKEKEQQSGS